MKTIRIQRQAFWAVAAAAAVVIWPNRLMAAEPLLVSEVKKIMMTPPEAESLFGGGTRVDGDTMVAGAPYANRAGTRSGTAVIFQRNVGGADNWGVVRQLSPSGLAAYDYFGHESAISGDLVAVATRPDGGSENSSGSVFLFERHVGGTDNWGQIARLQSSAQTADMFGWTIDLKGDTLVVGAPKDDEFGLDRGACYIFGRDQGGLNQWGLVNKICPQDILDGEDFGLEPSLSGDRLAVGCAGKDANRGASYIFERSAGGPDNWGLVRTLVAPDGVAGDRFGFNALDGDTLVVGAYNEDDAGLDVGSAYVFERNLGGPNEWGFVTKLLPTNEVAGTHFGVETAIEGNLIAITASGNYTTMLPGSVYLFERNQGGPNNWGIVERVVPHDPTSGKMFGAYWNAMDLKGDVLVVGAAEDDEGGYRAGAAYVFHVGSPPTLGHACQGNNVWLSWPEVPGLCFAVEYRPSLAPADSWQLLPDGRNNPCIVPMDGSTGFLRLRSVPCLEIISWPASRIVPQGGNITLEIQATGLAPLSYRWYHDGVLLDGVTGNTYAIVGAASGDGGEYFVVVSDACGTVISETATLTVL